MQISRVNGFLFFLITFIICYLLLFVVQRFFSDELNPNTAFIILVILLLAVNIYFNEKFYDRWFDSRNKFYKMLIIIGIIFPYMVFKFDALQYLDNRLNADLGKVNGVITQVEKKYRRSQDLISIEYSVNGVRFQKSFMRSAYLMSIGDSARILYEKSDPLNSKIDTLFYRFKIMQPYQPESVDLGEYNNRKMNSEDTLYQRLKDRK